MSQIVEDKLCLQISGKSEQVEKVAYKLLWLFTVITLFQVTTFVGAKTKIWKNKNMV